MRCGLAVVLPLLALAIFLASTGGNVLLLPLGLLGLLGLVVAAATLAGAPRSRAGWLLVGSLVALETACAVGTLIALSNLE